MSSWSWDKVPAGSAPPMPAVTAAAGGGDAGGAANPNAAKHARVMRKMDSIKLKQRSSLRLEDWQRYNYAEDFSSYRERIMREVEEIQANFERGVRAPGQVAAGIRRVHCRNLSVEEFMREYERPYLPVVIDGLAEQWPAREHWSPEGLRSGVFRDCTYKAGEDDDGHSVRVKLKTFLRYMRYNRDDSPLYIFDSGFEDKKVSKGMLRQYEVPPYFRDDLFHLVGEKRRPPYRWFLVGPERSGTALHTDPLATSAWNTLLSGHKLWVLFRPGSPKEFVKGTKLRRKGEDKEAITYFTRVLPRVLDSIRGRVEAGNTDAALDCILFVQRPGETVFVPGGWWHAVLNLDDTIAVTQNFASRANFARVWRKTRAGRKHMARRLLNQLELQHPHLAEEAHRLNREDEFEWNFTPPEERRARRLAKKRKKKAEEASANKAQRTAASSSPGGNDTTSSSEESTSDSSTTSGSEDSSSTSGSDSCVGSDPSGFRRLRLAK